MVSDLRTRTAKADYEHEKFYIDTDSDPGEKMSVKEKRGLVF
jgi:hypothetical protein